MGFLLIQEEKDKSKHIVKCGSISLKPAQHNYSVTELEGLAVWYACHKLEYFLLGREFDVYTDHKALVGLFAQEIHEMDNNRLQKLSIRMMNLNAVVKYVPGKFHYAADALSCKPQLDVMMAEEDIMEEAYKTRRMYTSSNGYVREDLKLKPLFQAAQDEAYQQVVVALQEGRTMDNIPGTHRRGITGRCGISSVS